MKLCWLFCAAVLAVLPATAQTTHNLLTAPPEIRVECTSAAQASELVGQHGCVAGRVSRVTYTRTGAAHISLCPARSRGKCSFHAVSFARSRDAVGDLSYLRGRIVAVVGDVRDYRGHPEIVVSSREQLQVAAGSPPPEFDAAQQNAGNKSSPSVTHVRAW